MELTGCDILAHCWRTYDAFWLPWSSRYHKSYHAVSCSGSKLVKRTYKSADRAPLEYRISGP